MITRKNKSPDPEKQPILFNIYLKENYKVLEETKNWIFTEDSLNEDILEIWHKLPVVYLFQVPPEHIKEISFILKKYSDHKLWIDSQSDRDTPQRLHICIKI